MACCATPIVSRFPLLRTQRPARQDAFETYLTWKVRTLADGVRVHSKAHAQLLLAAAIICRPPATLPSFPPSPPLSRFQPTVFDASAPYARTYEMRQAAERPAMEAEWRAAHAAHAAGKPVA